MLLDLWNIPSLLTAEQLEKELHVHGRSTFAP